MKLKKKKLVMDPVDKNALVWVENLKCVVLVLTTRCGYKTYRRSQNVYLAVT